MDLRSFLRSVESRGEIDGDELRGQFLYACIVESIVKKYVIVILSMCNAPSVKKFLPRQKWPSANGNLHVGLSKPGPSDGYSRIPSNLQHHYYAKLSIDIQFIHLKLTI